MRQKGPKRKGHMAEPSEITAQDIAAHMEVRSSDGLHVGTVDHMEGDTLIKHHLGVSGFADYAVVDRRSAVKIDEDVPA